MKEKRELNFWEKVCAMTWLVVMLIELGILLGLTSGVTVLAYRSVLAIFGY